MNNNYKDYDSELFKRGFKCDFSKFDLLPDFCLLYTSDAADEP